MNNAFNPENAALQLAQGIYQAITEYGCGVFSWDGRPLRDQGSGMFLIPATPEVHTVSASVCSESQAREAATAFARGLMKDLEVLTDSVADICFILSNDPGLQAPENSRKELSVANVVTSREDASVLAASRKLDRYFDITNNTWVSCKMERCACA